MRCKTGFKIILSRSVCWGIGYLASWIAKWSITSIALNRNIFAQALSSASTRVNGDAGSLHGPALSINAFLRNIACIFPFNFMKGYGYIAAIGVFVLLLMVYYLFRKNEKELYAMVIHSFILYSVYPVSDTCKPRLFALFLHLPGAICKYLLSLHDLLLRSGLEACV